jgi:Putative peptidoglycan binding domain
MKQAGHKRRTRIAALSVLGALMLGSGVSAAAPASAATYTCHFRSSGGWLYAGYYNGTTTVPKYGEFSDAAVEAQCLVGAFGISPGTIDGIYGSNTIAAIKGFQRWADQYEHAGLTVDGYVGPSTWPLLRKYANN